MTTPLNKVITEYSTSNFARPKTGGPFYQQSPYGSMPVNKYTDDSGFVQQWNPRMGIYEVVGTTTPPPRPPLVGTAFQMSEFDPSAYNSALSTIGTNLRRGLSGIEAGARNRMIGFQDMLRQIGGQATGAGTQFRSMAAETGSARTPDIMRAQDIIRSREAEARARAYADEANAAARDRLAMQEAERAAAAEQISILMRMAEARAAQVQADLARQAQIERGF